MKIIRWTARGLSIIALLFHILSFAGDLGSAHLQPGDTENLLVWGIIMAGMIAAWKWERLGGVVIIIAFLVQVNTNPWIISMWTMWVSPFIGTLFFLSGVLAKKGAVGSTHMQ